jgi:hypothetical protein
MFVMDIADGNVLEGLPRGCATDPTTVISLRLNPQPTYPDSQLIPTRLRPLMFVCMD